MGNTDVARETLALRRMVKSMQDSCAALEKVGLGPSFSLFLPIYLLPLSFLFLPLAQCPKPVIAAVHSACMGAGMDLVTACDIRLCSSDTWFQIKVTERGGEGGRQRCCETRVCTPHTTSHYSSGICATVTVQVHMLAVSFFFSPQEVEIGLAADIGTLQRLPKVVGNVSLARELVYTARKFSAEKALAMGLVR